jgi:Tol biopolymer transport system component
MLRARDLRGRSGVFRNAFPAALVLCAPVVLAPACGGDSGAEAGLLVNRTISPTGPFGNELIVRDAGGEEQRTIEVPEPVSMFPTGAGDTLLVRSSDNRSYVVDAAEGTRKELDLPAETVPGPGSSFFDGGRVTFMSTTNGDAGYLIDLQSAEVIDLSEITGEIRFVQAAVFSPDGDYLLLSESESGLWLIPTGSPDDARNVADALVAVGQYAFSADGDRFVYATPTEGGGEATIEEVDGSGTETVGSEVIDAAFARSSDAVLLSTREGVSVARGDDEPVSLTTETNGVAAVAPSGNVLVGSNISGWELVDLADASSQPLDDLAEAEPILLGRDQRWVLFTNEERDTFTGLDLDTGEVSTVLSLTEAVQMAPPFDSTADGRFFLLSALEQAGENRLWLLDLQDGEARELTGDGFMSGSLSDDGKLVAFSTLSGVGEEPKGEISLVSTDGGDPEVIGEGANPIWLAP